MFNSMANAMLHLGAGTGLRQGNQGENFFSQSTHLQWKKMNLLIKETKVKHTHTETHTKEKY